MKELLYFYSLSVIGVISDNFRLREWKNGRLHHYEPPAQIFDGFRFQFFADFLANKI